MSNDTNQLPSRSLRGLAMRGGIYTGTRSMMSLGITIIGVWYLTKELGPAIYGVYALGLSLSGFAQVVGKWGVDVHLIREGDDADQKIARQSALALVLLTSSITCAVGTIVMSLIHSASDIAGLGVILTMLWTTPLFAAAKVVATTFETDFKYRNLATLELLTQLSFYTVAIPAAMAFHTPMVLGVAFVVQQLFYCASVVLTSKWNDLPRFDADAISKSVRFGTSYSVSISIWQLRTLAATVVTAALASAAVVGLVSLTVRVVETLAILRATFWRVSVPTFAKLRNDPVRLGRATSEATTMQLILTGVPLTLFTVAATPYLGALLGPDWSPVSQILPLIAAASFVNSLFSITISALYMIGKTLQVAAFNAVHVITLFALAFWLVPRYGAYGYAVAEVLTCVTYLYVAALSAKHLTGALSIENVYIACLFILSILAPLLGYWTAAFLLLLPLSPKVRKPTASFVGRLLK